MSRLSLDMTKSDQLLAPEYVLQPLTKLAEQKSECCAWILLEHFHDTRTLSPAAARRSSRTNAPLSKGSHRVGVEKLPPASVTNRANGGQLQVRSHLLTLSFRPESSLLREISPSLRLRCF